MSITIRTAQVADTDALLAIYAPYVQHTAITFEHDVPTSDEFSARIAATLRRYPYLLAEEDGVILGYAYVSPFHARPGYNWSVETSIYLAQEARGKGIGRILHEALEETLRKMGILNMEACICCPGDDGDPYVDTNSMDFHTHMGYRLAGRFQSCAYKFNRWYDMVWMEKHIGDHVSPQPPVIPFPALDKAGK